jgi:hypothetical protein
VIETLGVWKWVGFLAFFGSSVCHGLTQDQWNRFYVPALTASSTSHETRQAMANLGALRDWRFFPFIYESIPDILVKAGAPVRDFLYTQLRIRPLVIRDPQASWAFWKGMIAVVLTYPFPEPSGMRMKMQVFDLMIRGDAPHYVDELLRIVYRRCLGNIRRGRSQPLTNLLDALNRWLANPLPEGLLNPANLSKQLPLAAKIFKIFYLLNGETRNIDGIYSIYTHITRANIFSPQVVFLAGIHTLVHDSSLPNDVKTGVICGLLTRESQLNMTSDVLKSLMGPSPLAPLEGYEKNIWSLVARTLSVRQVNQHLSPFESPNPHLDEGAMRWKKATEKQRMEHLVILIRLLNRLTDRRLKPWDFFDMLGNLTGVEPTQRILAVSAFTLLRQDLAPPFDRFGELIPFWVSVIQRGKGSPDLAKIKAFIHTDLTDTGSEASSEPGSSKLWRYLGQVIGKAYETFDPRITPTGYSFQQFSGWCKQEVRNLAGNNRSTSEPASGS